MSKNQHTAARRWVMAVNRWGQLGQWRFHVCRNPQLLDREIVFLVDAKGGDTLINGTPPLNRAGTADG